MDCRLDLTWKLSEWDNWTCNVFTALIRYYAAEHVEDAFLVLLLDIRHHDRKQHLHGILLRLLELCAVQVSRSVPSFALVVKTLKPCKEMAILLQTVVSHLIVS